MECLFRHSNDFFRRQNAWNINHKAIFHGKIDDVFDECPARHLEDDFSREVENHVQVAFSLKWT